MMSRRRRGFTLVELLVTLGVIVLLVALLLPAVARARQQAVRIKCAAHLRQIGAAVSMYASDYKGRLPVAEIRPLLGRPKGYYWFEHLAPYLQRAGDRFAIYDERERSVIWGCPNWEPDENTTAVGYIYNDHPLLPNGTRYVDCMWIESNNGIHGRYFRMSEVPNKDERGLVTDGRFIMPLAVPWNPAQPVDRQGYNNIQPTRHGNWHSPAGVNVLFVAGHVRSVSAKEALFAFTDPLGQR